MSCAQSQITNIEEGTQERLHFDIHCQYWKSIVYVTILVHCRFSVLTVNIETQQKMCIHTLALS